MRAVVQRSGSASVAIGGEEVGAIASGVVLLVGIAPEDGASEAKWLADKVANLRIFSDDEGKMNRSLLDAGGEALVVSQFTLYGDARNGRRPSFIRAAQGEDAERVYERVITELRALGVQCASGRFGADMQVSLVNDGPVTILLDSEKTF
ncbi:MAG: D-aminoacyl-tRNA deacylase [Actinomycetota bacterium]|jgi:D-tyrosyl-tRNA(Tyr) deacylase|nr:D-aminoacyl-tRNA deacylase [Actinomycetota bacterium]